ncbi:MAG: hypothetical protein ACOCXA_03715 [Planctomycetota bacterium]
MQRVLARARRFGLLQADRRQGWQACHPRFMTPDAAPGRGLVLVQGTADMAVGLAEVLSPLGLVLVFQERIGRYRRHGLVLASIRQRGRRLTIRMNAQRQEIVFGDSSAATQWTAGVVAGWRCCLLAAGLPPTASIRCRPEPHTPPSPAAAALLEQLGDLPPLAPVPSESACYHAGIPRRLWRRGIQEMAESGLVLRSPQQRWRRWRRHVGSLSLPVQAEILDSTRQADRMLIGLQEMACTIRKRPIHHRQRLLLHDDHEHRVHYCLRPLRRDDGDAICVDFESHAQLTCDQIRQQGCHHVCLISLREPQQLCDASRILCRHLRSHGLAIQTIELQSNWLDRPLNSDERADLQAWVRAGYRVALCSVSVQMVLKLYPYLERLGLRLGTNLMIGLHADQLGAFQKGVFAMPNHSMRHAGRVLGAMLQEQRLTESSAARQLAIPACLSEYDSGSMPTIPEPGGRRSCC